MRKTYYANVPDPGTEEAGILGCTCETDQTTGIPGSLEGWWIRSDCPIHVTHNETVGQAPRLWKLTADGKLVSE